MQPPCAFFSQLNEMVKIYGNIDSILEKINRENHLVPISQPLIELIEGETRYTFSGWFTRAAQVQVKQSESRLQGPVHAQHGFVQGEHEGHSDQHE